MTFATTIERQPLVSALATIAKVINKRDTTLAMGCVVIDSRGSAVRMSGATLRAWAHVEIDGLDTSPGIIAVDLAALQNAVTKSKAASFRLVDVGARLSVQPDGGAAIQLAKGAVELWPQPSPGFLEECQQPFALPAAQLRADLARAMVCVSTEETRYYLNGVFLHAVDDGATLRIASTDGHRLCRITRPAPEGMPADMPDSIVPRQSVEAILHVLAKAAGDVELAVGPALFRFRSGRTTIEGKLVDGTFPDYSRVIPTANFLHMTVDVSALSDTVAGCAAVASVRTPSVALAMHLPRYAGGEPAWLTATVRDVENGTAAAQVEGVEGVDGTVTSAGEPEHEPEHLHIGFNSRYLVQLLGQMTGAVRFELADPGAPTLLAPLEQPECIFVLMPLRLDSGGGLCPAEIAEMNAVPDDVAARPAVPEIEQDLVSDPAGPVEHICAREPDQAPQPEPVPDQADEPVETEPQADEPARRLYGTLQEFKVAAGVGSRWRLSLAGGEPETVTVTRATARMIDVAGESGARSRIAFPKQDGWSSDATGIAFGHDVRLEPDQAVPGAAAGAGDVAALIRAVAALEARLAAVEGAGAVPEAEPDEIVERAAGVIVGIDGARIAAPVRKRSRAHERAVRAAWAERRRRREIEDRLAIVPPLELGAEAVARLEASFRMAVERAGAAEDRCVQLEQELLATRTRAAQLGGSREPLALAS
jgi:DNA polymerase-3 subunit beta